MVQLTLSREWTPECSICASLSNRRDPFVAVGVSYIIAPRQALVKANTYRDWRGWYYCPSCITVEDNLHIIDSSIYHLSRSLLIIWVCFRTTDWVCEFCSCTCIKSKAYWFRNNQCHWIIMAYMWSDWFGSEFSTIMCVWLFDNQVSCVHTVCVVQCWGAFLCHVELSQVGEID